jgi:hypothetical protein
MATSLLSFPAFLSAAVPGPAGRASLPHASPHLQRRWVRRQRPPLRPLLLNPLAAVSGAAHVPPTTPHHPASSLSSCIVTLNTFPLLPAVFALSPDLPCSHEEWETGSEIQPAAYAASVSLEPTSSRRERQPGARLLSPSLHACVCARPVCVEGAACAKQPLLCCLFGTVVSNSLPSPFTPRRLQQPGRPPPLRPACLWYTTAAARQQLATARRAGLCRAAAGAMPTAAAVAAAASWVA